MYQDRFAETLEPNGNNELDMLENRLEERLSGRIRKFRLLSRGSGIVLRGLARTYHAKQLAQHAAMEILGQPIVANEIEVS